MVSNSCKKRFSKIMMEEMELVAQEGDRPTHLFYDPYRRGKWNWRRCFKVNSLHIRVPDGSKLLRRPISISELSLRHRLVA